MLGNDLLNASIRICNGPSPDAFDSGPSLEKFLSSKERRIHQKKRGNYKPKPKETRIDTLMDTLQDEENETQFEEADYLKNNDERDEIINYEEAIEWD